jgi:hypothetical protein
MPLIPPILKGDPDAEDVSFEDDCFDADNVKDAILEASIAKNLILTCEGGFILTNSLQILKKED